MIAVATSTTISSIETADIALTEEDDRTADTIHRSAACYQIGKTANRHLGGQCNDKGHQADVTCKVTVDRTDDHAAEDSGNNGHQRAAGLCVDNRNNNAAECYIGASGKVNTAADQQSGHAKCNDCVNTDISRYAHQVGAGKEFRRKDGANDQAEDQDQYNTEFTV